MTPQIDAASNTGVLSVCVHWLWLDQQVLLSLQYSAVLTLLEDSVQCTWTGVPHLTSTVAVPLVIRLLLA